MEYLKITLRLIHIGSGVFWVGSALFIAFFVTPSVKATAEVGQKFMSYLVTKARLTLTLSTFASLTILSGGWLYWIDANGNLTSGWALSGAGLGFGIGGLFGLIGMVFGMLIGKYVSILGNLGAQIQGKPTPEQMSQIQAAQKQLGIVSPISTVSVIIALICMATARYWGLLG
jgi:hypothetical protein